jgi:hypothetical protein
MKLALNSNDLQSPAPRMVSHKQMRKVSIEAEPENLWAGADEEIAVEKSEIQYRSSIITVQGQGSSIEIDT